MKGELLIQNFINLFLVAIILETALSAIFSLHSMRPYENQKSFKTARDIVTLLLAVLICYKIKSFKIFIGTGVRLPRIIDMAFSALIITRLAIFTRDLSSRIKGN